MLHEKWTLSPSEEGNEDRLAEEREIDRKVINARNAGKDRAGYPKPVPGAGKKGETVKGRHPHDKPDRSDPKRRETVRGHAIVEDRE